MAAKRLTRGRRTPWSCGHRGFGVSCARCSQANDLETKANIIAQMIKTKSKEFPGFVEVLSDKIIIRAGGKHISCATTNVAQDVALLEGITEMRNHASRLLAYSR